jgi:uncharacterized protein (TIGR00369 family)
LELYDDEWYAQWKQRMVEGGGNIIVALGLRPLTQDDEHVVMEMAMSGNVRQGTGVFAAGALMQLADVAATMVCQRASGSTPEDPKPFPLSVQISMNLVRNTTKGKATTDSRIVHRGRTMTVVESKVHDDDGRLLCIVTSTHVAPGA